MVIVVMMMPGLASCPFAESDVGLNILIWTVEGRKGGRLAGKRAWLLQYGIRRWSCLAAEC